MSPFVGDQIPLRKRDQGRTGTLAVPTVHRRFQDFTETGDAIRVTMSADPARDVGGRGTDMVANGTMWARPPTANLLKENDRLTLT